jgi:hypothetical protein
MGIGPTGRCAAAQLSGWLNVEWLTAQPVPGRVSGILRDVHVFFGKSGRYGGAEGESCEKNAEKKTPLGRLSHQ